MLVFIEGPQLGLAVLALRGTEGSLWRVTMVR